MENNEQCYEANKADQLQHDGHSNQVRPYFQFSWIRRVDGFGSAVAGDNTDNEVQTDEGRDHTARMDGREIRNIVKCSTKNDVIGQRIDWPWSTLADGLRRLSPQNRLTVQIEIVRYLL